ncbi:MAG: family 43 glycosylhydrolase [Bacteroidales bacterium]|nr:family 43 glycosylhydrolase [Bacteroidales bacterium]
MQNLIKHFLISITWIFVITNAHAQNPIIRDQFTADPTARIFRDTVFLYPSHDIKAPEGMGLRKDWFCMEDYHVFSSVNLTDWTDHGVIVTQNKVPWVRPNSYSMWAPDCIEKNGKYYFYFPAPAKDTIYGRGFSIGVAVANKPAGPYIPEPTPIIGVHGIDPCVLIDKDGQAYLYWSARNIYVARLKENMVELASEPQIIANLPEKGLKEGPYVFERNGIYYLTFPHVENRTERLEYAIGSTPEGPFKMAGVIMDEAPNGCWTNHHSLIHYRNQWYLFYHQNDLSPKFDKNRSVRIDSLFFNADGTIRKVIPTLRGVGITNVTRQIETDRYSFKSESGAFVELIDTINTFNGWKTILTEQNAWIQYNAVDFGTKKPKSVNTRVFSETGGELEIRLDNPDGNTLSEIKIPATSAWVTINAKVPDFEAGIHNIVLVLKSNNPIEIDWVQFLKN